jgi:uncharacterized YccA/Bax inhibitor family protein
MSQPGPLPAFLFVLLIVFAPMGWLWVTTRETASAKRLALAVHGGLVTVLVCAIAWKMSWPSIAFQIAIPILLIVAFFQGRLTKVCDSCTSITKAKGFVAPKYCSDCGAKLLS